MLAWCGLHKRSGQVDGNGDGAGGFVGLLADVDGPGIETPVVRGGPFINPIPTSPTTRS